MRALAKAGETALKLSMLLPPFSNFFPSVVPAPTFGDRQPSKNGKSPRIDESQPGPRRAPSRCTSQSDRGCLAFGFGANFLELAEIEEAGVVEV